jgi:hypothetical protein
MRTFKVLLLTATMAGSVVLGVAPSASAAHHVSPAKTGWCC